MVSLILALLTALSPTLAFALRYGPEADDEAAWSSLSNPLEVLLAFALMVSGLLYWWAQVVVGKGRPWLFCLVAGGLGWYLIDGDRKVFVHLFGWLCILATGHVAYRALDPSPTEAEKEQEFRARSPAPPRQSEPKRPVMRAATGNVTEERDSASFVDWSQQVLCPQCKSRYRLCEVDVWIIDSVCRCPHCGQACSVSGVAKQRSDGDPLR